VVHGALAGEAAQDAEGLQTVRNAAKNMAWLMRRKAAAATADPTLASPPQYDGGARTNFIR
jgi:hypothetical protein